MSQRAESSTTRVAILGTRYPDFSIEAAILGPEVTLASGDGSSREAIIDQAKGAAVILAGSVPRFDAATLENLDCRGIVRYGVGVDSIDLSAASRRGIFVANVPDAGTDAVALHTVALVLTAIRRIPMADERVRSGNWGLGELRPLHAPHSLTAGIVGFGRIGHRTAEMLASIGFMLLAHDPFVEVRPSGFHVAEVGLHELLERSDVVCLHLPATGDRPLIGKEQLALMKERAVLVNTARGALVDQGALIEALRNGRPAVAALDVFSSEPPNPQKFSGLEDRTIFTPHMAWYTEEAEAEVRRRAAHEARRILMGERPLNLAGGEKGHA
jgi:D-3-phosphoglycerate dehydrogenase